MSAVSKKVMPPSYAASMIERAVGSSTWPPKVIVPRQSLDTWSPVRPKRVYCMGARYRRRYVGFVLALGLLAVGCAVPGPAEGGPAPDPQQATSTTAAVRRVRSVR